MSAALLPLLPLLAGAVLLTVQLVERAARREVVLEDRSRGRAEWPDDVRGLPR